MAGSIKLVIYNVAMQDIPYIAVARHFLCASYSSGIFGLISKRSRRPNFGAAYPAAAAPLLGKKELLFLRAASVMP
jgi:hypothetical protein